MSIAESMRSHNQYKEMFNFGGYMSDKFPEVDIRFAEFIDWLQTQPQDKQDVVTLAMQLSVAFRAKFDPKEFERTPNDIENLERVEEAQKRLGIDFLYPIQR